VGHNKNMALFFCPYLRQLLTVAGTFCGQFISELLYISPHRKCIATLLCEI